jgi:hypothetical protein
MCEVPKKPQRGVMDMILIEMSNNKQPHLSDLKLKMDDVHRKIRVQFRN